MCSLAMAALSTQAEAGTNPPGEVHETSEGAQRSVDTQGRTTIIFSDDDDIESDIVRSQGSNVLQRGRNGQGSLITIRPHFIDWIVKLSSEIK
jgi:hypothetical protein